MKISLITTSINVPKVLALYRKAGPDVAFYIAADEKTPLEAYEFCADLSNCEIYSPDRQRDLGYSCSELLGWSTDSRRNIALLEAVKDGADVVFSCDDDMVCLGDDFFDKIGSAFIGSYSGLQMGVPGEWCDVGRLTLNSAAQRGLPLGTATDNTFSFANDVQIGAMQGIILGVPDTDAGTTMAKRPTVHTATDILRNGFVIDPLAKSVFNSQITAFRRELAPCFAQFYKWQGRNTDIFASLIMRRIMRETNLHTYFGPPYGFHNRSQRDPMKDLEAERFGVERVDVFARFLDACIFPHKSIIENLRLLWRALATPSMMSQDNCVATPSMMSQDNCVAAQAFLDDMESVL